MAECRPRYDLYKPLEGGLYLVKRTTDGETLLGHSFLSHNTPEFKPLRELFQRGAGEAASNVLNHENLVSVDSELVNVPLTGAGGHPPKRLLLWDYCDAGSLASILEEPPVAPAADGSGFLPESLVWHVGLSMLRALQWLHEGVREVYGTEDGGAGGRCVRKRSTQAAEPDWLPILHRNITAGNIFLQHPKGIETYGACKLGNFGSCYVSGIVSSDEKLWLTADATKDLPVEELKDRVARFAASDATNMPRHERPYTRGCELFALGAILFRMMTKTHYPNPEECNHCGCSHVTYLPVPEGARTCKHRSCPYWRHNDFWYRDSLLSKQTMYSHGLRNMVRDLLDQHRSNWRASKVLHAHWDSYLEWATKTADGKRHRDIFDDIHFRKENTERKRMEDLLLAKEMLGIDLEPMLVV